MTLDTSVQRSSSTPLQLDAAFRYSVDPDSHLTMSYGVVDQSRGSKLVLKSTLFVSHPVSRSVGRTGYRAAYVFDPDEGILFLTG